MSDTPTPPAGGAEGAAADGAGDETPWYSKPTTWIVLVLLLAGVLAIFLLTNDDDEGSNDVATGTSTSTSTSVSSTTSSSVPGSTTSTSTPSEATTTTSEGTDTGDPGVTPVAITESEVKAGLTYYPDSEGQVPFEDGGVEANWYTWDDQFVVVYAGWDATTGDPQCPGNSLESGGAFDFISNSPSGDGGCDPEEDFPNLVSGDEGARVCDGLVLYRSIIPTTDDAGDPTAGTLYGSIERAVEGGYVGATSMAPIDSGSIGELDFTAGAYTVPDGWLADGKTEVTC